MSGAPGNKLWLQKTTMYVKRSDNLAMLILLVWLLLDLGVSKITCVTIPDNTTDLLALQDFKNGITYDAAGVFSSWNSSTSHCTWEGVRCSPVHSGRVVALELPGLNLPGQISPSVGNLTFLKILKLSANSLSGQLPPLNFLRRLQILDLSSNTLHDIIPDALANCSNLRAVDLGKNRLIGEIPPNVGLLANLSSLRLSFNNLTGIIPQALSNITHIQKISLSNNMLTGSIPPDLGNLSDLAILQLGWNSFSAGRIPPAIFNLHSLQRLGLESIMLRGKLPYNIWTAFPNLQYLGLSGNNFVGDIPSSLGNVTGLIYIDLSRNNLSGKIPSFFGKFRNLQTLNLEFNSLEAMDSQFFPALTNCTNLEVLALDTNRLQGVLPHSIGNLSTSLHKLLLGGNKLSGLVPPTIGNLHGLIALGLASNSFVGGVEEWLGKLVNLQLVVIQGNNFTGQIPSSIGNLTKVTILSLAENKLEGTIPPGVGTLKMLSVLDFGHNNIQGNIPDLSGLTQLTELDLSSNMITGDIPDTLANCGSLQKIEMDQNLLTGHIPKTLGNLSNLIMLNLSHNNLSGTIPTTLNDLVFLTKLDLSYNSLEGDIPRNGVFEHASDVSLQGNPRLCGGSMVLHMPSCRSITQRTRTQYYLIRILIPLFGFMSLLLLIYFLFLVKKLPKGAHSSLPSYGEKFFTTVSYNDLAQATSNFAEHNLIGKGSYGSVYRGKLKEQKMEVAVKVFDLEMQDAERSFMSECETLRSIQHRNLLPIITACSTVDNIGKIFKALLYEFMPNGNLDMWLHQKEEGKAPKRLGFTQRINIAVNVADALDYLHHDCGRPTVHCDLKPSNILLNDDMTALLGDFGIARFYTDSRSTLAGSISTVGLKGTIGYIAPEYAGGNHVSTSGDVYSFGIVLLELMTGKRPTDPIFKDGLDIVNFVNNSFPHESFHVLDAYLTEDCKDFAHVKSVSEDALYQCVVSLLQLGLSCARALPSERMTMKLAAGKMHAIKASYFEWKAK